MNSVANFNDQNFSKKRKNRIVSKIDFELVTLQIFQFTDLHGVFST